MRNRGVPSLSLISRERGKGRGGGKKKPKLPPFTKTAGKRSGEKVGGKVPFMIGANLPGGGRDDGRGKLGLRSGLRGVRGSGYGRFVEGGSRKKEKKRALGFVGKKIWPGSQAGISQEGGGGPGTGGSN